MGHAIHKILISGTGRAGTTFLVRLLTELGLDTGYDRDNWQKDFFAPSQAGLEGNPLASGSPYIVKNPEACTELPALLASGNLVIDHVLIPVRDLESAARSRIRIGGTDHEVPGGLWGTSDPAQQKAVLAEKFHALVHALAAYDLPHTFLHFPRLVEDADYAYAKLRFLLGDLEPAAFRAVFFRVADPGMVHHFSRLDPATPDPAVAGGYFARQMRQRRQRRRRRAVRWCVAAAVLTMAAVGFDHFRSASPAAAHDPAIAGPAATPATRTATGPMPLLPRPGCRPTTGYLQFPLLEVSSTSVVPRTPVRLLAPAGVDQSTRPDSAELPAVSHPVPRKNTPDVPQSSTSSE